MRSTRCNSATDDRMDADCDDGASALQSVPGLHNTAAAEWRGQSTLENADINRSSHVLMSRPEMMLTSASLNNL